MIFLVERLFHKQERKSQCTVMILVSFCMAFPAAIFIRKYSYKAGVLMGLGLYATGALLFFPSKSIGLYGCFLMAYFIIVNLSKTYIQKKSRELTIMRINGFTTKECVRYAAWDLIITTAVGTALGLVLGGVLGRRILCMMEQPYIQFVREPNWRSFVLGALITLGFSWIINAFALRRVKHLKLSDIA